MSDSVIPQIEIDPEFQSIMNQIDRQIASARLANRRKTLFIGMKMTDNIAALVKNHYEKRNYNISVAKCPRGLWDIIVEWS